MRPLAALLVALLVVLAGCSVGYPGQAEPEATEPSMESPTASGSSSEGGDAPPDPETDVLGWEQGYWANETLQLTTEDGLNESERDAVVSRAMARVEAVRDLEFERQVPVEIVSRSEYQNSSFAASGDASGAFQRFDNAKFEAMFLVGEDQNSLAVQNTNRGASVLGFYSPVNGSIVIVSGSDPPDLPGEQTLAHELTHALQDQHFNLSSYRAPTRMAHNGQNGLIEGEANVVQSDYEQRCGQNWQCLAAPSEGGGGGSGEFHVGIYVLEFFPYSDGPGFVKHYRKQGGWERVNELYADAPASDEQIIYPEKYQSDPPADVGLSDSASNGWERVRPQPRSENSLRPDYASLGQSGLTAMFAYTLYDDVNRDAVIDPQRFLNLENGNVNSSDPFNYDLNYTSGWDGDRLHVYQKGGESAYVWKLVWDSPAEAREFATGYERLLRHYGATQVDGPARTYRIDDGPFEDSFRLRVDGNTVTIVNAPTADALDDVRAAPGDGG